MKARIEYGEASPEVRKAMFGLAQYLDQSGLEHSLWNLIDLRASEINGCAYCLDMHWKDLESGRRKRSAPVFARRLA
jgi:AhpD family alkylhydroperoxidase